MLQIKLHTISRFLGSPDRWWLTAIIGCVYAVHLPPFNAELSPACVLLPMSMWVALLPLMFYATRRVRAHALLHSAIFGFFASLSQYYWIANVVAEGRWHLILIGLVLISAIIGCGYFAVALFFRYLHFRHFQLLPLLFPCAWIALEYVRTVGQIGFPWSFTGYATISFLPLAQSGAWLGVYGLSGLIVLGNVLLWQLFYCWYHSLPLRSFLKSSVIYAGAILILSLIGFLRLEQAPVSERSVPLKVSLLQTNIDQSNWGNHSLDSTVEITRTMVYHAAEEKPGILVTPESALLCYLMRRPLLKNQVHAWVDSVHIPLVIGSLHWERGAPGSYYKYNVYNSAFFLRPGRKEAVPYHKIKLVPFSEVMPFENYVPVLSRVNLGESDFKVGEEWNTFSVGEEKSGVPLICYEIIFSEYVRKRVARGGTFLLNITNDGWFGKSTAPFQHLAMARMRCIENGISLVRCANSGITMCGDQYGRIIDRTQLYTRDILTTTIDCRRISTPFTRLGNWPIILAWGVFIGFWAWRGLKRAGRTGHSFFRFHK